MIACSCKIVLMSSLRSSSQNRNTEVEETFVATFISPNKQGRYNSLLANPARRRKFLNRINHNLDFNPDFARHIATNEHTPEGVATLLNQIGVKDSDSVYVITDVVALDTQVMPMRQAVEQTLQWDISAVVCWAGGKVAYYKPESPECGCILRVSR
jgi:hypothetical protein